MQRNDTLLAYNNTTCILWSLHSKLEDGTETMRDVDFLLPSILIPFGIAFAFQGYRLAGASVFLLGGLAGVYCVTGIMFSYKSILSCNAVLISSLIVFFMSAFIAKVAIDITLFSLGGLLGYVVVRHFFGFFPELDDYSNGMLFDHGLVPYWISVFLLAIGFGTLTLKRKKKMMIVITCFVGGFMVSKGIDTLQNDVYWVSSFVGVFVSLFGLLIHFKKDMYKRRTDRGKEEKVDRIKEEKVDRV